MEDFHEDIQSNIVSCVDSESVLNCKLVCKRWRQLLSNRKGSLGILFAISRYPPNFPNIQLYYADYDVIKTTKHDRSKEKRSTRREEDFYETKITKINLPPIEKDSEDHQQVIVGSCNGLVCLALPQKGLYDPVFICNPFTSEYTILPRLCNKISWHTWDVVSGFGYLPSTNEYKVIRILYDQRRITAEGQVQVYTLGSRSGWRDITETKYLFLGSEGILANESLYWKEKNTNKIVAFDLADEIFRELPTPPCIQFPRVSSMSIINIKRKPIFWLIMLGGYLCLVDHSAAYDRLDIWSFRKNKHQVNKSICEVKEGDYYHDWSWSKDISIKRERDGGSLYQPFALTKSNNEILIWSESTLKCYNPISKCLNVIVDGNFSFQTFKGVLHMNTLVSLKDLGEESKTWVRPASRKTQLISRKRKGLN